MKNNLCIRQVLLPMLLIATTLIPAIAHDSYINGIYYNLNSIAHTAEVTYRGKTASEVQGEYAGSVFIPENVVEGTTVYEVTSINRDAFFNCPNLTSIVIPKSIVSIENGAFDGCNGLTKVHISDLTAWCNIDFGSAQSNPLYYAKELYLDGVAVADLTIPEGVYSIKNWAFYNCSSLSSVVIPEGVTSIGHDAFSGCNNIGSVTIPSSVNLIEERAFNQCSALSNLYISDIAAWCNIEFYDSTSNPIAYADNLFINNVLTTDLVIPEGVLSIGRYAFAKYNAMTSVTIPGSIVSIGEGAFEYCSELKGVYISDIASWCNIDFYEVVSNPLNYAKKLYLNNVLVTDLIIPDGVTSLKNYVFFNCNDLSSVVIPESVIEIGKDVFANTAFYKNLPEGITYMGNILYKYKGEMPNGTTVTIPENVTSIATEAFKNCKGLLSVTIPNSICFIGDYAFYGCKSLKSATIPQGVEYIGKEAFGKCSDMTEFTFNAEECSTFNTGGSSEFAVLKDCSNLKTVNIGSEVKVIPDNIFHNYMHILNFNAKNCISVGTSDFYSAFWGCKNLSTINIGDLVETIPNNAFLKCSSINNVNIKGAMYFDALNTIVTQLDTLLMPNVTDISVIPFQDCKALKKLDIGSAENLNEGILRYSSSLTDLTLPFIGSGERVTATGRTGLLGSLFGTSKNDEMRAVTQYYSEDKSTIYYLPAQLEKLTIAEGCTELGYGALYGMSTLKEVTLPSSLYLVGEKAFYSCAGLEHIYCKGASPAACFDNTFTGVRTASCVLHVPYNTTDLYARSTGWKDFYYIQAEKPITISVTYNIRNGGIVQGLAEYELGDQVTLTAIANSGYRFVAWIENGMTVCNDATYTFTATGDCDLLVVFVAVPDENNVTVTPDANQVYFTWEMEEGVDVYTLTIYADAAMTTIVNTLQFDAVGNLLQRVRAEHGGYMIDGLSPETSYYYDITGTTNEGLIISQYVGTFTTTEDSGVDAVAADEVVVYPNPTTDYIAVAGIAPKTIVALYAMDGTLLQQKQATAGVLRIDMQNYSEGVYLLRVGSQVTKVVKH